MGRQSSRLRRGAASLECLPEAYRRTVPISLEARFPQSSATVWTITREDRKPPVDFTPVPRLRARRNGWTEDRQRGFIAALARCGSVSAASREVGISARSAYRLLDAPGAGSFAKAWDIAADCGRARLTVGSLDRALHGDYVPVYRRGKLVRVELRRNDRMAIAMLNGADKPVDDYRRISASRRRQSRQEWKQFDLDCAARAAEEAARAAAEEARAAESVAAYQAEVDAYIASCRARRPHSGPRIRML